MEYAYSVSEGQATHAWGRGTGTGGPPPSEYYITASGSAVDADDGTNTIEIYFSNTDGDFSLYAFVYDAVKAEFEFYLGTTDYILLANIIRNLDAEGEQMQGAFLGPYTYANGSTHTLTNLVFSVDRVPDYYYSAD
ncbi:MAG: hypothetical protein NTU62_11850 [Spirochaetes bacterium]|nr:hypothetical protein [Spirochaetota bacterium]